jgi:penicillin-binding protein 2
MEEGIISPERLLFDPGTIEIPNRFAPNDPGRVQPFVCWNLEGHGSVNMLLGIALSCDVYFYKIGGGFDQDGEFVEGLTVDRISQYATQFGYGRVQGIELPLESPGILPSRAYKRQNFGEPWSTGDDYNLSIGQGFFTSTPMQVAQMAAVVASGGFLYRPTLIHHMTDAEGNVVLVDENSQVVARARPGPDGTVIVMDAQGNRIEDPAINIRFDSNGRPVYQPQVIDSVNVSRQYLDIVAQGMRLVNVREDEDSFFTGATYVDWTEFERAGLPTAGKTGTSEYCDNIAIARGWCRFEDIEQRRILPTHSWYVSYAPFDDPEIVVSVFVFNGGEGSAWAAPVACHVMGAYFGLGQYAAIMNPGGEETAEEGAVEGETAPIEEEEPATVCLGELFNPQIPPLDQLPGDIGE